MEAVDKKDVASGTWLKCGSRYVSGVLNTKLMHYSAELRLSLEGKILSCYFELIRIGIKRLRGAVSCLPADPSSIGVIRHESLPGWG